MKIKVSREEALKAISEKILAGLGQAGFDSSYEIRIEENSPGVTPTVEAPKEPSAPPIGANHLLIYIYCIANYRDSSLHDLDTLKIKMLENMKGVSSYSIEEILDSSVYLVVIWWLTYGTLEGYTTTMAEEIALKLPN